MELLLEMTGVDIVILMAFFGSTLIGALRGFTKELLSLFSWGGAMSLSYIFLPLAQGMIHEYIANPIMAGGVGFFCLFVISLVILSIIASVIAGYIHESSFRCIDHSLGFGFGILRGVVFISAVELGFSIFWPRQSQPPAVQMARFIPMARKGGDTLLQIFPVSARKWILEQAAKVENQTSAKLRDTKILERIQKETDGHGGISEENIKQGTTNYEEKALSATPSSTMGQRLMQGSGQALQGYQQEGFPQVMAQLPQRGRQMVVIRSPKPGQAPQLVPASGASPIGDSSAGGQPSMGLTQSAMPRDKQSTVDALSQLKPQSSSKEENGYTRGQRDDMDRLLQAAGGE